MTNFVSFANRIAAHLAVMQKSELFTAAIEQLRSLVGELETEK